MTGARMTAKAMQELDDRFALQIRAMNIFKAVVAEWTSDPRSVQCFDLRMVEDARVIDAQLKRLNPLY